MKNQRIGNLEQIRNSVQWRVRGWVTHVNEKQTFNEQWTEIVHQKWSLMALKENRWRKNRLLDKLADMVDYLLLKMGKGKGERNECSSVFCSVKEFRFTVLDISQKQWIGMENRLKKWHSQMDNQTKPNQSKAKQSKVKRKANVLSLF